MPLTGSVRALENTAGKADTRVQEPPRTFRDWLDGWSQVLIAELLHLLAHQRDGGVH